MEKADFRHIFEWKIGYYVEFSCKGGQPIETSINIRNFGTVPCKQVYTEYSWFDAVKIIQDGSNTTNTLNSIEIDQPYESPSRKNVLVYKVAGLFSVYKNSDLKLKSFKLATLDSLVAQSAWKSMSSTTSGFKAYKVNGLDWIVRYDTNIGDLPAMTTDVTPHWNKSTSYCC